jgi:hypothetical protein
MNRCVATSRARAMLSGLALAAAAATTLLASTPAAAQVHRNFPQNALRGVVTFGTPPDAQLNGKPARLAPGARIHGLDNMLLMSGNLIGSKFTVDYTLESNGLLYEIWLLRADEAAVQPWPETPQQAASWKFDPIAQAWTTN